jgi:hypothetical protein
MLLLEHGEWATSDGNSGITSGWSVSWRNAVNFHVWFSIFKEAWVAYIILFVGSGLVTISGGNVIFFLSFIFFGCLAGQAT